jgi:hypothetical protein
MRSLDRDEGAIMTDFGWSYPAGCSGVPDDEPCGCDCCGKDVDNCTCPECPTCGATGDPKCYEEHSLKWVRFTKRTDDPKLAYLERRLDGMGVPHRRNGFSFHAPIMEVPEAFLERADAMLQERVDWWDGSSDDADNNPESTRILDDIEDDDPFWEEG